MNHDAGVATIKKFVLIVEDEEDIRELVSYHLLKEGYPGGQRCFGRRSPGHRGNAGYPT